MEFGPFGASELLFIAVLALVVFGPRRLPEMGHAVGRLVAKFRRATADLRRSWEEELDEESRRAVAEARQGLADVRKELSLTGREAWTEGAEAARAARDAVSPPRGGAAPPDAGREH